MTLLSRPFPLHDIDDTAAYCAPIVERYGADLEWHDREDLHAYLVETAWQLSLRHDASRGKFSAWLGWKLGQRAHDWRRQRFGRTRWKFSGHTYERERPRLVSVDADHSLRDQLELALGSGAGDREADRDTDLEGLDEERDRQRAWDLAALGLEAARRAP